MLRSDALRFLVLGATEDGQRALIACLLEATQAIPDAPVTAPPRDGQLAVPETGSDPGYRYFATARRGFGVAEFPAARHDPHPMLNLALTAAAVVILVDGCRGLHTQTRRQVILASLAGIRHLILAVDTPDLGAFEAAAFADIRAAFERFAAPLGFASIALVPLSVSTGTNIRQRAAEPSWYPGSGLIGYLETLAVEPATTQRLVFPVARLTPLHGACRGFAGTLAAGRLTLGDELRDGISGHTARVARIIDAEGGDLASAAAGQAVTLTLDRQADLLPGAVLGDARSPLETTDQFEASLFWLAEEDGLIGRSYDLTLAGQAMAAALTSIKYRIDVDTLAHHAGRSLQAEDIAVCNIAVARPLVFDVDADNRILSGFVLTDRFSGVTVAVGRIRHSLRRSRNVHAQPLTIRRADREGLNGHRGRVVWFTGLSGSGKSTLANALEVVLHGEGYRSYVLDGDNIRQGLNRDLGFTDADRVENIRRIAEVARLMLDAGLVVITAFISPFRREREMARELIGAENFVEVYLSTPLQVCETRDPKGLYAKARRGELPNLSGIGSPYEVPEHPALSLDSSSLDPEQAVDKLLELLRDIDSARAATASAAER